MTGTPDSRVRAAALDTALRVLLVEDQHDLAANIGEFLQAEHHRVDFAADGPTGLHLAQGQIYDVIVLDLGLPGMDGLELCRRLREEQRSAVPVLMLTARDTERDALAGFAAGADDYLTKPFSLALLDARLRALHRRHHGAVAGRLQVLDLVLDLHRRCAWRGDRRLDLTPSGLRLLERLMSASPAPVSRDDVEFLLWGDHPPDNDGALRTHIHALRQAVDRDHPLKLIRTVHGLGWAIGGQDAP